MESMGGHILPAIIFISLGVWHLLSLFATYLKSPREYSARAWYPVFWLPTRLKNIELYLMVVLLPLAIFYDLGISTHFQPLVDGAMSKSGIVGFEQVTILFMFWFFAVVVLVCETTTALPLPTEGSFLFASVAFGLEWMSITHQIAENMGLEGQCERLLGYTAAACASSSAILALRPKAFLVDMLLCMGLILQGTWHFQMALSLYSDRFIPLGCRYIPDMTRGVASFTRFSTTQCELEESKVRAIVLMDLVFHCHIICILFFSLLAYGVMAKLSGHRRTAYDPLSLDGDSDAVPLKNLANLNKLSCERR